jgi:hypothetical protein
VAGILALFGFSAQVQADLVIAATVLFLVFATFGLIAGPQTQAAVTRAAGFRPTWATGLRASPFRAAIIVGLLCGLVVLAFSCY